MAERVTKKNKHLVYVFVVMLVLLIIFYTYLIYFNIVPQTAVGKLIMEAILGIVIIEITGGLIYLYLTRNITKEEARTLRSLFRIVAYLILVILILAELGENITGLLVSAGFLGIVLGLAAQSTIANFVAGIYLLASKTFEPNDRVTIHTWQYNLQPQTYPHDKFIPGFSGVIKNIGILYTELTNDDGVPVYAPNNIVAQALVINYHRAEERTVRIQFDVNLSVPYIELEAKVKKILKNNKIRHYSMRIDYMHSDLYVVTLRLTISMEERATLKTELFQEILKFINKYPHGRASKKRHLNEYGSYRYG